MQSKSSSSQVIQKFQPTPADNLLIREHKQNEVLNKKGWTENTIKELVEWCKSAGQYLSFINNLTYDQWKILRHHKGDDYPTKVRDAWVTYQKEYHKEDTLVKFRGYKCCGGREFSGRGNLEDWSGCYIGTSIEQARGYITDCGQETGIASIWELKLIKKLPVVCEGGKFLDENIKGEIKAKVLKSVLNMAINDKLIASLGKQGKAYIGPGGESGNELVMTYDLVAKHFIKKRVEEYEVTKQLKVTLIKRF